MSRTTFELIREVEIEWSYQRAEPQTMADPGCPEEWEICASFDGNPVELTPDEEERVIEQIKEGANEPE